MDAVKVLYLTPYVCGRCGSYMIQEVYYSEGKRLDISDDSARCPKCRPRRKPDLNIIWEFEYAGAYTGGISICRWGPLPRRNIEILEKIIEHLGEHTPFIENLKNYLKDLKRIMREG